jgi:hypothetical protein
MNASVANHMGGGVAVIEAEADILRSAEQVFDYASDPADEPEWNIRLKRVEKLTGGPVGRGCPLRDGVHPRPCRHQRMCAFRAPGLLGTGRRGRRSSAPVSAAGWCPRLMAAACCCGCRSGFAGVAVGAAPATGPGARAPHSSPAPGGSPPPGSKTLAGGRRTLAAAWGTVPSRSSNCGCVPSLQ